VNPLSGVDFWTEYLERLQPTWELAQWLWATENTRYAVILLGVAALAFVVLPGGKQSPRATRPTTQVPPEKPLPKHGGQTLIERIRKPHAKPVKVGGITFDRAWRHIGVIATTGARKSTLLALLADELGVPCIVITGDHAPPLENWTRSVSGWVWTPRGHVAWYPWGGPLEYAVQRAEYMHPSTSGDVGVGRSMFKQAARVAWRAADERGEIRTLAQLRAVLPSVVRGQTSAMMVENWTARLQELEQSLGDSLGADLDIVETLRQGTSVMISLNSFQDTSNRGRFAHIAVLEAMRAADTLGNIGVVIDEVGLVGGELFDDAVRVLRVRLCAGLFASQLFEDFPPAVRDNIGVYFLGQQSGAARASRQLSSETTFGTVAPEAFGEHALPHGTFYVVAGGRVQVTKVPTWERRGIMGPTPLPLPQLRHYPEARKPVTIHSKADSVKVDSVAVVRAEGPPEMPKLYTESRLSKDRDRKQLINIWEHHVFRGGLDGCYESTYHVNNRGRPSCSFMNGDWTTYILMRTLEDARLQGLDEEQTLALLSRVKMLTAGGELTVDHICENEVCDRPEHLAWEDRSRNSELFHERKREAASV
jgi:hypothetical protein